MIWEEMSYNKLNNYFSFVEDLEYDISAKNIKKPKKNQTEQEDDMKKEKEEK